MDYQIAVPSYKRPHFLVSQTIQTLKGLGSDLSNVTVFVANPEEKAIYTAASQTVGLSLNIVVGVPGLLAQRVWYNTQYYSSDTKILNLDDDIAGLFQKTPDNKVVPYSGTLDEMVRAGFETCDEHGARLWGIAAALNGYFLKNTTTVGLRYVCGIFHGSYAGDDVLCGGDRVQESSGEDFETTLRSFKKYGKVVRLDGYAPKTKYFAEGGIQAEIGGKSERDADHSRALESIASRYPDLAKTYTKAGGVTNIRLKVITEAKIQWESATS